MGLHEIKTWSRTQASVALSSAESELNALVSASSEALCIVALSKECHLNIDGQVLVDSSAAQGIVHRQGVGKVKHLQTHQLWVQEVAAEGRLRYTKVPREHNLSGRPAQLGEQHQLGDANPNGLRGKLRGG